ncbi:MAG: hypothetical protein ACI9NQ_001383 [Paracoccaceae bacterium]
MGLLRKLPLIAIALTCVVVFWFLGSWLGRRKVIFRKLGMNDLSAELLQRVLKLMITGLGIFIALEILDATAVAAGVLGVAGVAGVALGFAFRNIVENYPEPIYRVHLHEPGKRGEEPIKLDVIGVDLEEDVSVDDTIDRQVAAVPRGDDEDNLLADEE